MDTKIVPALRLELEQAKAHLEAGRRHIEHQKLVISELERDGLDVRLANSLLQTFFETQALHEGDVLRLAAELERLEGSQLRGSRRPVPFTRQQRA